MEYRVLCIDDSKSVHAFLKDALRGKAVKLTSAFDGEQGLEIIKSAPVNLPCFQLIFLDWEMPKLTGPEVFDALCQLNIKIPVIMLTSKNEISNISMMFEKGVVEYIMKPFTKDILLEKARTILKGL